MGLSTKISTKDTGRCPSDVGFTTTTVSFAIPSEKSVHHVANNTVEVDVFAESVYASLCICAKNKIKN